MKAFILSILLFITFNAWSHKPVFVQTQEQAVQQYTDQVAAFQAMPVPENAKFVQELKHDQVGPVHLVTFTVKADWGPITGLIAFQNEKVIGIEIIRFTEHEGHNVTKEIFLDQFKGLSLSNLDSKTVKPLPKEPKTSQALLEAVKLGLKTGI